MESLITAAARALEAGDPLGALNRVALRNDAPSLALRGIAMAQLGDLAKAKTLLRSAARAFGPREAVARARCVVAEAEIALVSRDLSWPVKTLAAARATLEQHGDLANAAHAGHIEARRLLLVGQLDEAERTLAELSPSPLPPASQVVRELVVAGIAIRRLRAKDARAALNRAALAARQAKIPALVAEVDSANLILDTPAARLIARGSEHPLLLGEVERLATSTALVVDTFHHALRRQGRIVSLGTRPVLFALARLLAQAWPADVSREELISGASGRSTPTNRIARGCAWRSGGSAPSSSRWPTSARRNRVLCWRRARRATSSCWHVPSRRSTPRCSPSSPTASPGRARRSRWRWERARARCSGPSTSWRGRTRCNRSDTAGHGAG